ncbi:MULTISPECIES: TetR/AcrR family transcriptional regulator [unclassified Wenzhouxiangella]|uniref:TetR/AcrR family transcriptional regulator n=1 Tax=unclassified Wenzhouxiangella TaxID=2613841 RepID=UPI000E32A4C1|nr:MULTISPECIES: TetR/AcrR family transcriptional regulator [unclassified Wenzhouxiangella]RFF28686.1 TetR/AcrR family transcriptional regulator [Wenzhouxiangella sp. 15181]RFP70257.1 TetR/AcrR family transcriptional regulator [Wenzhouxiangella sp. 15190]
MSRNTRERIQGVALTLFNELGEPHVPTNRIADELEISPGNLHYHFRTKGDLIQALFESFEHRMLDLLATPDSRNVHVEDIWFFLHLVFETIGEYRFIYRDLTDLCGRFRNLQQRFQAIIKLSMQTARHLSEGLADQGQLEASPEELDALVRNIVLVSTFWLSFDQVAERNAEPQPDRAAWQVMSLIGPYLVGEAREELSELARAYRRE